MQKAWKTVETDPKLAAKLAGELKLAPALAGLLVSRGLKEVGAVDLFLKPRLSAVSDPFELPGMERAVRRIWEAVDRGERIVVFGDYDADGLCSTALMVRVLTALGATVVPFLPHRIDDGYGLGADTLERCLDGNAPGLVVTVDCGTSSAEAVELAGKRGVDVVVTDHHEPSGPTAAAVAVVNPKLGEDEDLKVLAGVGVAFKVCYALLKRGRDEGREVAGKVDLREYLDLVALGTIADVVPLQGENRIFCRHGLALMGRTRSTGLRALISTAGVRDGLRAYHVGFIIGPRLNAVGRLGDAQAALELLLTDDEARARELALQLDAANRERQGIEAAIVEEAVARLDGTFDAERDFGLVIAGEGWHPGVIGIVAARIVQRYYRPAVVLAIDEDGACRGSCRSIEGFNLVEHLARCGDLLESFGGHAMAAGVDLRASDVEAFRERFNTVAAGTLRGVDLRPVQVIDGWLSLAEADEGLLAGLEQMRPYGFGNRTPVWAARGVRVLGQPRVVGNGHLKMLVGEGAVQRDAIGFGLGERKLPDGPIDVAFHLQKNTYMGRETLQLNLQDFRPSAD